MNAIKTKLVWIGKRKYSREKSNVSSKLEWGSTTFSLLGIKFCVSLNDIPDLNYNSALERVNNYCLFGTKDH